jgi:hypothetical protein
MPRPIVLKVTIAASVIAILVLSSILVVRLGRGTDPAPAPASSPLSTPRSAAPAIPRTNPPPSAKRTPAVAPGPSTKEIKGFRYRDCVGMLDDDPDGAWYFEPNYDPALDRDDDGHACDPEGEGPSPRPTEPVTGVSPSPHPTPSPSEGSSSATLPIYLNCDAARRAGAAPVHRGDPGYGRHLDLDGDGVGCES